MMRVKLNIWIRGKRYTVEGDKQAIHAIRNYIIGKGDPVPAMSVMPIEETNEPSNVAGR
jgi:hypothetical protein